MNLVELMSRVLPEGWSVKGVKDTSHHLGTGDWVEITSPVLDRRNDAIQIYGRMSSIYIGGVELTDDGFLFRENNSTKNCRMMNPSREFGYIDVLNRWNVYFSWGQLKAHALSVENLAERARALVAAIAELDAGGSQ